MARVEANDMGGENLRFCKGTLALALSGILVKLLGMLYKIPLANLLGDEGMGYFNAAYTVYTVFFVLATAGLPVALSLMIAEAAARGERGRLERLYAAAEGLFLSVGLLFTLLMALPAREIATLIGGERSAAGILAVSPAILFTAYGSAARGYFQGLRQMIPLAVSQLVEAAGKLIFGLAFIRLSVGSHPLSAVAAYGILGLTVAAFLAMLYLVLARRRYQKRYPYQGALPAVETWALRRRLLSLALPITVGALVTTLASSMDLFLLMRLLQGLGYSPEAASAAYGNYSALAVPLFNMPTVLILPIAYGALPIVRGALAAGDREGARRASLGALRMTALLAIPASVGLSLFAKPILSLLFTDGDSVARAAPLLTVLALGVFPLALLTVSSSLLQAYGKLWFPMIATLLGIGVKLTVTLLGLGRIGLTATPMGTFLCYTLVAALTLGYLACIMGGFSVASFALKPLLASLPMGAAGYFLLLLWARAGFPKPLATLLALGASVLLYFVCMGLLKGIRREDLMAFGLPQRLLSLFLRLRLVR